MSKIEIENKYRKWWIGKYCRLTGQIHKEFKKVIDLVFYSPPSGFCGSVELIYEDGSIDNISQGNAFRPRKRDVEIKENN